MRNEVVERELSELVNILVATVPSLRTIKVAGSYNNGDWDPERSDIDMLVITDDENLAIYKNRTSINDGSCAWISRESPERSAVRQNIKDQMNGDFKDKFNFALFTPRDLKNIYFKDEGRGPIGANYLKGRHLYGDEHVSEVIEAELSQLVNILVRTVPSLKSVRVIGSYNNGNWNPEKSDIDMIILTNDKLYSYRRDRREISDGTSCGWIEKESVQREELATKIKDQMTGKHKDKFSLSIITPKDLRHMFFIDEGRGYIGLNFATGRLLYGKETFLGKVFDYYKQAESFLKRYVEQHGQVSPSQAI